MNSSYAINGGLYSGSPVWSAVNNMSGGGQQRQDTIDFMLKNNYLKPMANPQAPQSVMPTYSRPQFTPNAFTQSQLAGMGQGATPQWMMDAYTQKIGSMGGNANQPPFSVTQSGFPGMGGKAAPSSGGAAGWRSGGTPMARQGK